MPLKRNEARRRFVPDGRERREIVTVDGVPNKSRVTPRWNKSTLLLVAVVTVMIVTAIGYYRYEEYRKEMIRTPLPLPPLTTPTIKQAGENPWKFWGSYRPQLYFGLKTRTPQSPVVGLMWLPQLTQEMPPPLRHWCNQDDKLPRYGWLAHDGRTFGVQEIVDRTFVIQTDFVQGPGGADGWTARISAQSMAGHHAVVSLMFYIALDGPGGLTPHIDKQKLSSITGYSEDLGVFEMKFITTSQGSKTRHRYLVTHAPGLDKLSEVVLRTLHIEPWDKDPKLPYHVLGGGTGPRDMSPNFVVTQVTGVVPFELEIIFSSVNSGNKPNTISGPVFDDILKSKLNDFHKRFESTFNMKQKGFNETQITAAKAAMSNMVGGIGYFYGSSIVQSRYNVEPIPYWPAPLYTAVPSRSFFPRGFLWDEGFHNLLISAWDPEMSTDIIAHWFNLINIEGWIPREQILGVEARAKVPGEFVIQRNQNANPPTFFLPLQRLVKGMIHRNSPADHEFLQGLFDRLKVWYNWYNTTQVGPLPGTYQWHGRDAATRKQLNPLTLTSGLDDYPRASHPTSSEFHIDLRCWIALASNVMADIAKSLNENWRVFANTYSFLTDNALLDWTHWSDEGQHYADYGLHTTGVKLQKPKPPANLQPGQHPPPMDMDKIRVVTEKPEYQFVQSFGYISLFPFLLKIIDPDSPKLFKILNDIRDPRLLWTDYGLRSLSKTAKLYNRYNTEHDPPYWRGAIWINMNYLAVSALHHYAHTHGPHQTLAGEIYGELRQNIIDNLIREYYRTGYIWEQYDDTTGQGKRCHPFTGWSALFVLMMAEKY